MSVQFPVTPQEGCFALASHVKGQPLDCVILTRGFTQPRTNTFDHKALDKWVLADGVTAFVAVEVAK